MLVDSLAALALVSWLGVLLLTSFSWRTRERIEPEGPDADPRRAGTFDLGRVCVLIPARNESAAIGRTLQGLAAQGRELEVVVVDDQSDDATAAAARAAVAGKHPIELTVVDGRPLPDGWGGKLWALEQALELAGRDYCLLLDAEIFLEPGMLATLLRKAEQENRALVSVMARLNCESFWEKLLVPPFVFFFKLLYPFVRVNDPRSRTAAAAGGCVLIRTEVLRSLGGFASIRDALIDDCALARHVKRAGHSIWLGLSESAKSARAYPDLASFRRMVARTAFTQLRYSVAWLGLVVALMLVVFVSPLAALALAALSRVGTSFGALAGAAALVAMSAAYLPMLRFYGLAPLRALTLPLAAMLFLAITIESAVGYWRGVRAEWKGRTYAAG
jgi:hopene-associated glycosyltransferase HpnB